MVLRDLASTMIHRVPAEGECEGKRKFVGSDSMEKRKAETGYVRLRDS